MPSEATPCLLRAIEGVCDAMSVMLGSIFVSFAFLPIKLAFAGTLLTPLLALESEDAKLNLRGDECRCCRSTIAADGAMGGISRRGRSTSPQNETTRRT